jgi:hypothetical protein
MTTGDSCIARNLSATPRINGYEATLSSGQTLKIISARTATNSSSGEAGFRRCSTPESRKKGFRGWRRCCRRSL